MNPSSGPCCAIAAWKLSISVATGCMSFTAISPTQHGRWYVGVPPGGGLTLQEPGELLDVPGRLPVAVAVETVALHVTNRLQRVPEHISRSVRRMAGQWKDSAPLGEQKFEIMPDVDFDTP